MKRGFIFSFLFILFLSFVGCGDNVSKQQAAQARQQAAEAQTIAKDAQTQETVTGTETTTTPPAASEPTTAPTTPTTTAKSGFPGWLMGLLVFGIAVCIAFSVWLARRQGQQTEPVVEDEEDKSKSGDELEIPEFLKRARREREKKDLKIKLGPEQPVDKGEEPKSDKPRDLDDELKKAFGDKDKKDPKPEKLEPEILTFVEEESKKLKSEPETEPKDKDEKSKSAGPVATALLLLAGAFILLMFSTPIVFANNTSDTISAILATDASQNTALRANKSAIAALNAKISQHIANPGGSALTQSEVEEWAKEAAREVAGSGISAEDVIRLINKRAVTLNSKNGELAKLKNVDKKNAETADRALTEALTGQKVLLEGFGATQAEVSQYLAATDPLVKAAVVKTVLDRFKEGIKPDLSGYVKLTDAEKLATKVALDQEISDRKAGDEAVIAKIPTCEQLTTDLSKFLIKEGYLTKSAGDLAYDPKGSGEEAAEKVRADLVTQIAIKADGDTLDQLAGQVDKTRDAVAVLAIGGHFGADKEAARKILGISEEEAKKIAKKAKALGLK